MGNDPKQEGPTQIMSWLKKCHGTIEFNSYISTINRSWHSYTATLLSRRALPQ